MSTESVPTKPVIEERIYVGNVHYKTTKEELEELFADYKLVDIEIPFSVINKETEKEFKKYLGFAFAQFDSKDDADKVVEKFAGYKLHNRAISMRKAVPPLTEEEKRVKVDEYKAKKASLVAERKAKKELKEKELKDKPKKEKVAKESDAGVKIPDGTPSQDTVFVTNLDYKVKVKDLNTIFKEYNPKWIHIPTKRVHYKQAAENGSRRHVLNKGIAFVKFADEETQKKVVAEFNGHLVNGREIIVDFAVDARIPGAAKGKRSEASKEKSTESEDKPEVKADEVVEEKAEEKVEEKVEEKAEEKVAVPEVSAEAPAA